MAEEINVEKHNKQFIQAAFEAWRNGTGGVFDLLAADAKWTIVGHAPVSRTYTSRQEFLDVVINPFNARLSSRLVPTVRALYADGDTVIAWFDAEGMARDGKPYRNTYTWYLQMRDDKIVNATAFFDTIEFTDFWNRVNPEAQSSRNATTRVLSVLGTGFRDSNGDGDLFNMWPDHGPVDCRHNQNSEGSAS